MGHLIFPVKWKAEFSEELDVQAKRNPSIIEIGRMIPRRKSAPED